MDWLGAAFTFFFFFFPSTPIPKLTKPSEKEWKKKKKKKKKKEKKKETKPRNPMWKGKKRRKKKKKKKTRPNVKGKKKKKEDNACWREQKVWPDLTTLWLWVPQICVYLPKCRHNFVFITQIHLNVVFNFHNSSLKNQRIEWWKQKLKTNPNKPNSHGAHQFWVISDETEWWVMENTKSKQPLSFQWKIFLWNLHSIFTLFFPRTLPSIKECNVAVWRKFQKLFSVADILLTCFVPNRLQGKKH